MRPPWDPPAGSGVDFLAPLAWMADHAGGLTAILLAVFALAVVFGKGSK